MHAAEGLNHTMQGLSNVVAPVRDALTKLTDYARRHEQQTHMKSQQQLCAAATKLGLIVLLVATAFSAVSYGRIWELHVMCSSYSLGKVPGNWMNTVLGGRAWLMRVQYGLCCLEHMGEWSQMGSCKHGDGKLPSSLPLYCVTILWFCCSAVMTVVSKISRTMQCSVIVSGSPVVKLGPVQSM